MSITTARKILINAGFPVDEVEYYARRQERQEKQEKHEHPKRRQTTTHGRQKRTTRSAPPRSGRTRPSFLISAL
jgi:hypothetical protein